MIYSSWDIEQNILKLVILGHFLPFYPPKNPKNQNFEKWKNLLKISSFYTCVPKITIYDNKWCTVPEIQSETDIIFCDFGLFFALLKPKKSKFLKNEKNTWRYHHFAYVYQKLWWDDVWFLRYGTWWTEGQTNGQKKWHIEVGAPPKKIQKM